MSAPPPIVAVDIPEVGDERLKSWAKVVDSVDETKSSGWAFVGPFIATGGIQDVAAGSVVLVYGERGSRANPRPVATVYTVNADATLSHEAEATGKAWARTLRDQVAELLANELRPSAMLPDLSRVPDEVLMAEVRRRGLA
ncbi:MAG TPA: hypothetical protein VJ938_03100 [Acidimicrobiia bacterium]|nr:hypothetical protein [Acidimicrobiia bacterium]